MLTLRNPSGQEVFRLLPPVAEINGKEIPFTEAEKQGEESLYLCGTLEVSELAADLGNGLCRIVRKVTNAGRSTRTLKLITEAETLYLPARYLIPCVNFNGNGESRGKEQHGTELDGEDWIYAYDRISIPSCTVSEDADTVCALFASDVSSESLRSSASLRRLADGRLLHRIFYPVTEAPLSYIDHDVMGPRYDEYFTLAPRASVILSAYLFVSRPKWKNYGAASLMDRVLDLFHNLRAPARSPAEVWKLSIAWSEFLRRELPDGSVMFANALRHNAEKGAILPRDPVYEAGWSGQCFLQARMFLCEYERGGEKRYLDDALRCLDAWMKTQRPCGLFPTNYARHLSGKFVPNDVCNYSWGAAEALRAYRQLKRLGIERESYVAFARGILEFLIGQYDAHGDFGLRYTMDGERLPGGGSIGGFTVAALIEMFRTTDEQRYLDYAVRSFRMYFDRDLENFLCTAGAIDCVSIDKETAYPFLWSALQLYELTGEDRYLTDAQKVAYYFFSWAYHYDALYDGDSDFARYGYYTSGGTAVSTQHHAIDPWGEIAVPDFLHLARLTGDERWKKRAKMLWNNAILCITDEEKMRRVAGFDRPYGCQSEAFFQARWTRYRPDCEHRGHLNDMYVGWVAAYRLYALTRLETELPDGISAIK